MRLMRADINLHNHHDLWVCQSCMEANKALLKTLITRKPIFPSNWTSELEYNILIPEAIIHHSAGNTINVVLTSQGGFLDRVTSIDLSFVPSGSNMITFNTAPVSSKGLQGAGFNS